jgi:hypothetical protein
MGGEPTAEDVDGWECAGSVVHVDQPYGFGMGEGDFKAYKKLAAFT